MPHPLCITGAVGDVAVNEVSVHPGWKDAVLTVSLGHVWDPRIMDGSEGIKLAQGTRVSRCHIVIASCLSQMTSSSL